MGPQHRHCVAQSPTVAMLASTASHSPVGAGQAELVPHTCWARKSGRRCGVSCTTTVREEMGPWVSVLHAPAEAKEGNVAWVAVSSLRMGVGVTHLSCGRPSGQDA